MFTEGTVLETFPNGDDIMYMRVKVPFMTERDTVMYVHEEPIEGGGMFFSIQSTEHEKKPPVDGIIRMFQHTASFIRPDPTDPSLHIYTELFVLDMKGSVPALLVNMTLASESAKEIKNLY